MALSREELIALVERLQRADFESEAEGDRLLLSLERAVPDPAIGDLIYWHDPPLSAAEIVDRALSFRPIELGSQPRDG